MTRLTPFVDGGPNQADQGLLTQRTNSLYPGRWRSAELDDEGVHELAIVAHAREVEREAVLENDRGALRPCGGSIAGSESLTASVIVQASLASVGVGGSCSGAAGACLTVTVARLEQ